MSPEEARDRELRAQLAEGEASERRAFILGEGGLHEWNGSGTPV